MKLNTFILIILLFSTPLSLCGAQNIGESPRTGTFEISHSVTDILGEMEAKKYTDLLDINAKIKWYIHVPDGYDPKSPPGALFTSEWLGRRGGFPIGWASSFDEKNLIGIILRDSPNYLRQGIITRVLSFALIQKYYSLDGTRIYAVGHNYSCENVRNLAISYPNIVKGAVFVECFTSLAKINDPARLEYLKKNRFVFISGSKTAMGLGVRKARKDFTESGIKNTIYQSYPMINDAKNLTRVQLNKAISYLDGVPVN